MPGRDTPALMRVCCASLFVLGVTAGAVGAAPKGIKGPATAAVLTRTGEVVEGTLKSESFSALVEGKERTIKWKDVLSVQLGDPASPQEAARIQTGLMAVAGTDRKARDLASETLTEIGLPVLTPLLASYKDVDAREPKPHYRLFNRVIPSHVDGYDRTLDLIRLASGDVLRGDVKSTDLRMISTGGTETTVGLGTLRRVAVRRPVIEKSFDIHSLYHCSQIEFLDAGVGLSKPSQVTIDARGFTRLAFAEDGWASDPDGLKKPGPRYSTNLVEGFPFGALIGRVGAGGTRWMAGKHVEKTGLDSGRLYLAINDNPHWQNNLGTYRVTLRVTDAYDLGDPQ